jgi:hypothetical protein
MRPNSCQVFTPPTDQPTISCLQIANIPPTTPPTSSEHCVVCKELFRQSTLPTLSQKGDPSFNSRREDPSNVPLPLLLAMTMSLSSRGSVFLVLCLVLVLCPAPALAFGAGNIPGISTVEGQNWRHGDIEDMLKTVAFLKGHKWSTMMIKRVYFGNWLRDYRRVFILTFTTAESH